MSQLIEIDGTENVILSVADAIAFCASHPASGLVLARRRRVTKGGDLMDIEKKIEAVTETLERADIVARTLFDASKSLGALITACSYLAEIVLDQQRWIERMQDEMQVHLETTP